MTTSSAIQQQFRTDGFYLAAEPVLPGGIVQAAVAGMDAVREGRYDAGQPPPPSHWNPGDDPGELCKIELPQQADLGIRALVSHPDLGHWAARVTGARRVQVWWTQLLYKPPQPAEGEAELNIGWHQDRHYWRAWEEGSELFTAWVALSDVTADAGPMRFVRGSHRWGLLDDGGFYRQDLDDQREAIPVPAGRSWEEVPALLPQGGASFHHCLTFHGSGPNRSAGPRRSLAIHMRTEQSAPVGDRREGLTAFLDDPERNPVIFCEQHVDPVLGQLGLEPSTLPRRHLEELDRKGFTILPGIIDPAWRAELARAFDRLSEEEGDRAGSEVGLAPGVRRLADLANKGEVFDRIYLHPALLRAVWHVLKRPFKLHSLNGHDPLPGQGQQHLHTDWGGDRTVFHVVNSMWMLDEFTADNGATRVVPGTHLLPEKIDAYVEDRTAPREGEVQLIAPAGSVGIFNGSLWHSCSHNRTTARRRTLHCAFIAREHPQQTDQKKYLRPETARRLGPLARYVLDV